MGKYLKKFENHSDYKTYIDGQDAILPNVSLCEDQNDIHYNPIVPPITITKFFLRTANGYEWIVDSEGKLLVGGQTYKWFFYDNLIPPDDEPGYSLQQGVHQSNVPEYELAEENIGVTIVENIIHPTGDDARYESESYEGSVFNAEITYDGETAHLVNGHFVENIPIWGE